MLRKTIALLIALTLCWTTVACSDAPVNQSPQNPTANTVVSPSKLANGNYPVQQASYNDVDGLYTLMLLNTPSPVYRTTNLQMARLSDEAIARGEKTYLEIQGEQAVMYLTEDFKIEYVHTVTENQTNPQTGKPETVIVRQESSFWTPFAGALAGQALGSLLFTPQYYIPPVYHSGSVLTGYGSYGSSYNQAVDRYRTTYNTSPHVETNRNNLRTSGSLRNSSTTTSSNLRKSTPTNTKSSGSGYGNSQLKNSGESGSSSVKRQPTFGSNSRSRNKSFGSSRRRR